MKKLLTMLAAAAISCFCLTAKAEILDYGTCKIGDYVWVFSVNMPGDYIQNPETGAWDFVPIPGAETYASIVSAKYDSEVIEDAYLEIPESITYEGEELPVYAIESEAFLGRKDVVGVSIPGTLEWIGYNAFLGCRSLETLEFEDSEVIKEEGWEDCDAYYAHFLEIGEGAFALCDALESVEFPAQLMMIDERAFSGCDALEDVVFRAGDGVISIECSIESYAFENCQSLMSVDFEDWDAYEEYDEETEETLVEWWASIYIGDFAFRNCNALEDLYLGDGVREIGESAFERDVLIESVEFPSTLEYINRYAFCDCASLEEVDMEACEGTLEYVENAFDGTPWGGNMGVRFIIDDGVLWGCKGILPAPFEPVDLVIPYEVTSIGSCAFANCDGIASVHFPETVKWVGDGAFEGCPDLTSVFFGGEGSNVQLGIGRRAFAECKNLESVVFEDRPWDMEFDPETEETYYWLDDGNYDIAEEAFYNCQNLSELKFGVGLTYIGEKAFQYCTSLESVSFPWSLSGIESLAFGDCISLEEVTVDDKDPEEDPEIAEDAFLGTPYDGTAGIRLIIEDNCVIGVEGIIPGSEEPLDIEIPDGIEGIGEEAFMGIENLATVTIPASVGYIGDYAFKGCTGLEYVEFEAAEPIDDGDGEYYYETILEIGSYAFQDCSVLTSLYLPPQTTYIGESAFEWCSSLEEVYFEADDLVREGELYISQEAFNECESLATVCFEDRPYEYDCEEGDEECSPYCEFCISIGYRAFAYCPSLSDLYLGVGVCEIGDSAFAHNPALEYVEFPWTVETIDSYAFGDCESLEVAWFDRDEFEMDIAEDAFEDSPCTFPNYRLDIEDGAVVGCELKPDAELVNVEIPDDVDSIAEQAFAGIEGIASVYIPLSVEYIGPEAFADCESLEDVEFEGDMEDICIDAGAFWNTPFNDTLDFAITVYDGVVTGFLGTEVPEEIVIPDGVTEIGVSAFDYDCYTYNDGEENESSPLENVKTIFIPASVEQIDKYAFFECKFASYVEIANPYVKIDAWAFKKCSVLDKLTLVNPGMAIISMTLTGYAECDDEPWDPESDYADEYIHLEPGESVTVDPDFSLLFNGPKEEGKEFDNIWATFNWGIIAKADFDPTGSGESTEVELILGEPYGDVLNEFQPEVTRHGQVFDGWLVNGKPVTPETIVGKDDVITPSWSELEYNPLFPSEKEEADTAVASIYDGYILDKDGASVGTIQVKVGKENERDHHATVAATAQLLGQKKITGFKAKDGGKADFSGNTLETQITLVKAGQTDIAIVVGKNGLVGTWGDYSIAGTRNTSKTSAADYTPWIGVYTAAFETKSAEGAGAAFAQGYSFVSVSVAAKGKVKATGVMADGTKVNCSGQLLIAEGGNEACVNVLAPMYAGKTGGVAFTLWIAKSGAVTVESVSTWKATASKTPFTAKLDFVGAKKLGSLPASLQFSAVTTSLQATIAGGTVQTQFLPTSVAVNTAGGKLTVAKANKIKADRAGAITSTGGTDNDAALKLNYNAKTGAFKGSFSVYTLSAGKLKKVKANVTGGFADGVGFGSAVIKGVGTFPVTLSAK